MMKYYHVTDGVIDDGPRALPQSWKNISGIDRLSNEALAELGWLPQVIVGYEPFDPDTQLRSEPETSVLDDRVELIYTVALKSLAQLRATREHQAREEARQRLNSDHDSLDHLCIVVSAVSALAAGRPVEPENILQLDMCEKLQAKRNALLDVIGTSSSDELITLDVTEEQWWS